VAQRVRPDIGIGHTRWATHGRPSERNAHPHQAGSVIVVHNGIIENYLELKEKLKGLGRVFKSDTDTEVISHIIDEKLKQTGEFEQAVRMALQELRGAYAVCILCENEPGTLIAAKQGSPMVVGLGEKEYLVASDIPAILAHTREMVFMEDGEMAVFRGGQAAFSTIAGEPLAKSPATSTGLRSRRKRAATSISCSRKYTNSPAPYATPSPAG
jgi:glucosamine--fructose-6-phosphate aminotransferase (isomerizing)